MKLPEYVMLTKRQVEDFGAYLFQEGFWSALNTNSKEDAFGTLRRDKAITKAIKELRNFSEKI